MVAWDRLRGFEPRLLFHTNRPHSRNSFITFPPILATPLTRHRILHHLLARITSEELGRLDDQYLPNTRCTNEALARLLSRLSGVG